MFQMRRLSCLVGIVLCTLSLTGHTQTPAAPTPKNSPTTTAPTITVPQHRTSAVMSPKCDEAKIRELAGDALIDIKKGDFDTLIGFVVTLDVAKLDFAGLSHKMLDAGCF